MRYGLPFPHKISDHACPFLNHDASEHAGLLTVSFTEQPCLRASVSFLAIVLISVLDARYATHRQTQGKQEAHLPGIITFTNLQQLSLEPYFARTAQRLLECHCLLPGSNKMYLLEG